MVPAEESGVGRLSRDGKKEGDWKGEEEEDWKVEGEER